MRAALILDNKVVNVIEYDPESEYKPEEGLSLVEVVDDLVSPGWILEDGELKPLPEEPALEPESTPEQKRISALEAAVDQLILDQLMGG